MTAILSARIRIKTVRYFLLHCRSRQPSLLDLDLNVKRTLLPTVKATDAGTGSSRRSSMTLPLPSPVKAGQRRSTPIVNEHRGSLFDDL